MMQTSSGFQDQPQKKPSQGQRFQLLILAQVTISGSWGEALHQAPCVDSA